MLGPTAFMRRAVGLAVDSPRASTSNETPVARSIILGTSFRGAWVRLRCFFTGRACGGADIGQAWVNGRDLILRLWSFLHTTPLILLSSIPDLGVSRWGEGRGGSWMWLEWNGCTEYTVCVCVAQPDSHIQDYHPHPHSHFQLQFPICRETRASCHCNGTFRRQ